MPVPMQLRGSARASHANGTNRLLGLLPKADQARLLSKMERLQVTQGSPVYECNERSSHVHFPVSAVLSVVMVLRQGETAELRTVGNEGCGGIAALFGTANEGTRAFYQIPGETLRMPAADFADEVSRAGAFSDVTYRYAQAVMLQMSWLTVCERLHPIEMRAARWMLTCHDAVRGGPIHVTHDVLAQMLGVRRPSISIAASALQKAGLIRYRRGVINILDRTRLEEASCECYAAIRHEFKRLLPTPMLAEFGP